MSKSHIEALKQLEASSNYQAVLPLIGSILYLADRVERLQEEKQDKPTGKNTSEITNFIESSHSMPENLRGYWSAQTVDLAVGYLSRAGHLEFRKPAPPAPAQPVEVLATLSDVSTQLPLDKPVPRNATVEQAEDYLARVRAQQPYARSGSFGTRF